MFDFYADAYNYETLRGSNATVALFAYTATFGKGFSGTLSVEDSYSRRAFIGTAATINGAGALNAGGIGTQAGPAGGRVPDVVANLRYDAPWGAVQATGALHYVQASLYPAGSAPATGTSTTDFPPLATSNQVGFAGQLGVQFNLDQLAPGDKLWLQGTYTKGAVSYTQGNNL